MQKKGIRAVVAIMAAAAGWTTGPARADYKAGMDAMAVKDYARARVEFEAEPANALAIYQLSQLARAGLGEARDESRSVNLLQRAADLGHERARFEYAVALGSGRGVAADPQRAMQLLEQLSEAGRTEATVYLGRVLRFGWWGVPTDDARSATLFKKAADAGDDLGTTLFAQSLQSGAGVPRDEARAAELVKAAAARGLLQSELEYARVLTFGLGVPKDEAAATAIYRRIADTADPVAQYGLAMAYLYGKGIDRDPAAAARWLDAAARQGLSVAQRALADLYRTGTGVPVLKGEAFYWYTVAGKSSTTAGQQANERRAILARDMGEAELTALAKRADAFQLEMGFRPRRDPLPTPSRGDSFTIGTAAFTMPAPAGYANAWHVHDFMQRAYPNDPTLRPLLMLLARQEDVDRMKLGLRGDLRRIAIARYTPDDAVTVTPTLFTELKKSLQSRLDVNVGAGRFRIDSMVRDDDQVFAFVRSGVANANLVDGTALLLLKGHVVWLSFEGFHREQMDELKDVVRKSIDAFASANRSGFF
jgi:TPR repeat protein